MQRSRLVSSSTTASTKHSSSAPLRVCTFPVAAAAVVACQAADVPLLLLSTEADALILMTDTLTLMADALTLMADALTLMADATICAKWYRSGGVPQLRWLHAVSTPYR